MRGFTLAGVSCLWINLTIGIIIELIPPHPLVNEPVLLSVTQIDDQVQRFSWYKGGHPRLQDQILVYSRRNSRETPGPLYSSRFRSFPNASLEISHLCTGDQGNYTVLLDVEVRGTIHLPVYTLVTIPVIRSSTLYAIANETVTLTCETMNSEKIRWGRSGKTLPPGVIWSNNYRDITFPNIKPMDAGLYWCEAENTVSKKTSDIYALNVYCICGSESELNAGEISGIIIGTFLGLLVVGMFLILFFQRHKHPVKEEPGEDANKTHNPPIEYYNVQEVTEPNLANQEPVYMDLQCSSQDTYSNLHS